jgi:hypothetical protein
MPVHTSTFFILEGIDHADIHHFLAVGFDRQEMLDYVISVAGPTGNFSAFRVSENGNNSLLLPAMASATHTSTPTQN